MADTDCGACDYPDCDGYSNGLVTADTTDTDRCEPGGEETQRDIELIFELWNGLQKAS